MQTPDAGYNFGTGGFVYMQIPLDSYVLPQ